MRRLYLALLPALPALLVAACDPELTVQKVPGGAPEGGTTPPGATPPPPPATDDGGTTDGGDEGGGDGGGVDGGQAHKVDGINDFAPGEKLATTSSGNGYDAYVAWDAKNVFFGMSGADVSASTGAANTKWVLVYLGAPGVAGTTTGIAYDCSGTCPPQQATLPFSAAWHIRYKIDGSYPPNVQKWTGSQWADAGISIILTTGRVGTFVEMGIPLAQLGSPSKLDVHMNMLIEDQHPPAWTYAGVPSTSFTDGFAPAFTKYFEFDLTDATKAPNAYTPKP